MKDARTWLWLGPMLTLGWLTKLMIQAVVMNEYRSWAGWLAKRLVQIASHVCPSRAEEWQAELESIRDGGESGILLAHSLLRGALSIRLREINWSQRLHLLVTTPDGIFGLLTFLIVPPIIGSAWSQGAWWVVIVLCAAWLFALLGAIGSALSSVDTRERDQL